MNDMAALEEHSRRVRARRAALRFDADRDDLPVDAPVPDILGGAQGGDSANASNVTVDMSENYDVSAQLEELSRKRFSMQPVAIAAFRQAAAKCAQRLLNLVDDDAKFGKLKVREQIEIMNLIFDRAYGRTETASAADLASLKTDPAANSSAAAHGQQLREMEARLLQKAQVTSSASGRNAPSSPFPELAKARPASVVSLKSAREEVAKLRASSKGFGDE